MWEYIKYIIIIFAVLYSFVLWKFAEKTNRPGWSLLIPVYSNFVWCDIIKLEAIWAIASFMPMIMTRINPYNINIYYLAGVVGLLVHYNFCQSIAKRFGKGLLFTFGLFFLKPLFITILTFDKKCRYTEW